MITNFQVSTNFQQMHAILYQSKESIETDLVIQTI